MYKKDLVASRRLIPMQFKTIFSTSVVTRFKVFFYLELEDKDVSSSLFYYLIDTYCVHFSEKKIGFQTIEMEIVTNDYFDAV